MSIKKFLLDWVWQLPQNLCGIIYKSTISTKVLFTSNKYNIYVKDSKGNVSLGKYIFISKNSSKSNNVILHECGHCIQSYKLGPLYLLVVGLPSLIHAALHKYICSNKNYYHFFIEKWTNKLVGLRADKTGRLYKINQ